MRKFEDYFLDILKIFDDKFWIEWIHDGSKPATTNDEKIDNILIASQTKSKHCATCMNVNGCYFPVYNMPQMPLHYKCHCRLKKISDFDAEAVCEIGKFSNYIFIGEGDNPKKKLFESWGYLEKDSDFLREEFEKQAKGAYENGKFELGKLNEFGQRISIEIILKRKNMAGTVAFQSGWMVYPYGKIKLTTPYGGKIK